MPPMLQLGTPPSPVQRAVMTTVASGGSSERQLVALAIEAGKRDLNDLTNLVFYVRHPEMTGRRIRPGQADLVREWLAIRDRIVKPALAAVAPAAASRLRTTAWLRAAWRDFECAEDRMVPVRIFRTVTPVNPLTTRAFAALEEALGSAGYRPRSVWNYNCRDIKGQPGRRSLHAYGLALDIDPRCNPHRRGAHGDARFSPAATQWDRCQDVQAGWADTTFTPDQVAAVEAIQTVDGLQVFAWGGRWSTSPDPMHFQVNVTPGELRRGIARGGTSPGRER
jgi:D-alanyl-D-alanine carboxypeptidase